MAQELEFLGEYMSSRNDRGQLTREMVSLGRQAGSKTWQRLTGSLKGGFKNNDFPGRRSLQLSAKLEERQRAEPLADEQFQHPDCHCR